MKTTFILTFLISSQVYAAPLFEDLSNNLPQHSYSGEWNHFVGGGVAVMDCNNDALPDIFAPLLLGKTIIDLFWCKINIIMRHSWNL